MIFAAFIRIFPKPVTYDDWTLLIPLLLSFRLESLPFLSTWISIAKYSNAHADMLMLIRNVHFNRHRHILLRASERSEHTVVLSLRFLSIIVGERSEPLSRLFNDQPHDIYISSSLALLSSLLSYSFYLLDQRTISGVEILKMTGKTAQSYYVLTTATFQAYRRLTVKYVRSRNVPI